MRKALVGVLIGLPFVAGCSPDTASDGSPPPAAVVVYTGTEHGAMLTETFEEFTAETGIPVTLKVSDGDASSRDVIENRGVPPADVLITSNVTEIWRAADEGALRPLTTSRFDSVPMVLKDPERSWTAIAVRAAMIVSAPGADLNRVDDYGDLATADLRGKVCLSSSTLSVNRSVIAMLIEDIGIKPAERMVRAWVRNLAASPYATEQKLVDALRSGACQYGIVSSDVDVGAMSKISPYPLYQDIDGIGVARHATQPESAHALVDWLLESNPLAEPESSNGRNLSLVGWHDEDVRLLAERAGYR